MVDKSWVKAELRKEEERRRRQAKLREQEIFSLMEEQEPDLKGKLWGEKSITQMAQEANGGEGEKWETDFEAKLVPDWRNPERILVVREVFHHVTRIIEETWGASALGLFLDWLYKATVAELALERDIPFTALLDQIKAMVAECRLFFGENPEIFPFKEIGGKIAKKINRRRAERRMMEGKSTPADEASRIYLSEAEKKLPLDVLLKLITEKGQKISRATAHRAKKTGWYMKADWQRGGSFGQKIFLSEEEKKLPSYVLEETFGISRASARTSKTRGFFVINNANEKTVKILNLDDFSVRQRIRSLLAFGQEKAASGEEIIQCALCSGNMKFSEATIDHIIPKSQGGHDLLENLCLAHEECNRKKGDSISPLREGLKKLLQPSYLPEEISEISGRKIQELSVEEMIETLGFSERKAGEVLANGVINTKPFSRIKKADLLSRLQKISLQGWPKVDPRPRPEKIFLTKEDKKLSAGQLMEKYSISRWRAWDFKKRGYIVANHRRNDSFKKQNQNNSRGADGQNIGQGEKNGK